MNIRTVPGLRDSVRTPFDERTGLLLQGVLCTTAGIVATLFATAANMGRFSNPADATVLTTVAYAMVAPCLTAGAFGLGDVASFTRARARATAAVMTSASVGAILFVASRGRPDAAVDVVLSMPLATLVAGVHVGWTSWQPTRA